MVAKGSVRSREGEGATRRGGDKAIARYNADMRRRLQFSLRTLLVALTIISIWLGIEINADRRKREAVDAIQAAGGKVFYDYQLRFPGGFARNADPNAPRWLRKLLGDDFFGDVVDVDLNRAQINDEWLARLNDLPRIERLNLAYTPISDVGIVSLSHLRKLRAAYLEETAITEKSVEYLVRHCPDLRTLDLSGPGITDASLEHISRLRQLQTLVITQARITDAGLASLRSLDDLEMF